MMYHLRQAWLAFRANLTAGAATLSTMTLTLTLLAFVALVTLNLEGIVRGLERDVQITTFLAPTENVALSQVQADTALSSIRQFPEVESAQFIPKDEAYAKLVEEYPSLKGSEEFANNPLQDRIVVRAQNPRSVSSIADQIKNLPGVQDLEYGENFVNTVLITFETVRNTGYVLVLLLVLNTLLNILNTIRVAMFARRDEIQVMRMIGATRGFIRAPYILEGLGLALTASLLMLCIVVPSYSAVSARVAELVPFVPIVQDLGAVLRIVAAITGLGLFLGFIGSLLAANRYLREVE